VDNLNEIEIPSTVPAMTLRGTVLFPHAVMPLYIFEPRYRQMLADVLEDNRLFAIFNEIDDPERADEEPPALMGTLGVVRACHQNPDGTSHLALQGLMRVQFLAIEQESPYRVVRIEAHPETDKEDPTPETATLRQIILDQLKACPQLTESISPDYLEFICSIEKPGPFIDVAAYSLCPDTEAKQTLLETLALDERYTVFVDILKREKSRFDLYKRLQGETRDEEIDLN
jgi:Lon protease-like protein